MKKEFKKVPLEDMEMVYKIYCQEENIEVKTEELEKAKAIYKDLLQKGNYTYACYIDDQIVGVINIYKNMQYYPTDLHAPYVHLECCMVDKNYQHQGIGTELIKNAVDLVEKEGCTYIIAQSPVLAMQKILYHAGLTDKTCIDHRKELI